MYTFFPITLYDRIMQFVFKPDNLRINLMKHIVPTSNNKRITSTWSLPIYVDFVIMNL